MEYIETKDVWKKPGFADPLPDDDLVISNVEELIQFKNDIRQANLAFAESDDRLHTVNIFLPELNVDEWALFDESDRISLFFQAQASLERATIIETKYFPFREEKEKISLKRLKRERKELQDDLENIRKSKKVGRLEKLLQDLDTRLKEKYSFKIFQPDSINYGLLVNYRQTWTPESYQVGELVSTIPLAPRESRKYHKKTVINKKRAEKEIENSLSIKKRETNDKTSFSQDIVDKATNKTNFAQTASGGGGVPGVWNVSGSTSLTTDTGKESEDVKKSIRESVLKAAEEFKNERRTEITTEEQFTEEEIFSGEISNPNDEITVTYLFYELQRRYRIKERLHKVTPVILVANEVPRPNEIDEDWLLTNGWILKRVILDDSFIPALDYLLDSFAANELEIDIIRSNLEMQTKIVNDVSEQLGTKRGVLSTVTNTLERRIAEQANIVDEEGTEGFGRNFLEFFGGNDEDVTEEGQKIRIRAAKDALDRINRETSELAKRLESEGSLLQKTSQEYATATKNHFTQRTEIDRLRIHVKDNILYYMQSIWQHEFNDQRFFRLFDKRVPKFEINVNVADSNIERSEDDGVSYLDTLQDEKERIAALKESFGIVVDKETTTNTNLRTSYRMTAQVREVTYDLEVKKLIEVADLDNLLGFKGNYMIFPLKDHNPLTTYLMQDFFDERFGGIIDPDRLANLTLEDIIQTMKDLQKRDKAEYLKRTPEFTKLIEEKLDSLRPEEDEIIIPSNSLFIEALPGVHPVLESFKEKHRAIDVEKGKEELRQARIESIRKSARMLLEGKYDDEYDKRIEIKGNKVNSVTNVTEG